VVYEALWASGVRVRWRTPTWKEFQGLYRSADARPIRNLKFYQLCVLDGPAPDRVPAGIVAWLGVNMLDQSPFTGQLQPLREYVQLSRSWFQASYLENARALIAGTFRYTFEEIESWDAEVFFKRLAAAEFLVNRTLEPADPSATKQQRQMSDAQRRQAEMHSRNAAKKQEVENRRHAWGAGG
jgi:hypothetical protein